MAPPPMGGGGPGRRAMHIGKPKDFAKSVKRLLTYLKPQKFKIVAALLCVLVSVVSTLSASYMLRPIINSIVPGNTGYIGDLFKSLIIMAVIYFFGVAATYLQNRIMISVSQNCLKNMRCELFEKMQKLPIKFFDTNNTGDIMSRYTNDVDTIGEMFNSTLIQMISGVMSLIGTLGVMIYTNVYLAIVTVVMVPLFGKAGTTIAGKSRKFFLQQQEALGNLNSYIEETVTGQKVVKVFCREEQTVEEFNRRNKILRQRQIRAQFIGGITGPVMGNLSQINYALTATVGSVLCALEKFDVGGLTIFIKFSRQFSRPINELSMQMTTIMSALAGAERVFKIMDAEPEPEDSDDSVDIGISKGEIVFDDVTFGYNEDKVILKNISLYAKAGQKIAFVGSTGAGKTTIINLLTRFYDIDSGTITIDGIDIKKIKRESLHKNIAMVLQDTHLFSGTVMENIRYGRLDATDEEVIAAAKTSYAHNFIKHLPNGYDTVLEGDGANLSQGQRQLLNIARAALSKAPVLILDEATSSVDTKTEQEINKGIDRLIQNRTTFVIAHRLSTIRNSNAIMVLDEGKIIERGRHEDLLELKGRYYELYMGLRELD